MEHKITIMKYQTMFPGMTKKLFDEKERFYQIAVISIRLDELQTKGAVLQKMGKPTKSGTRMTFAPVQSAGEYEAEMQRILEDGKKLFSIHFLTPFHSIFLLPLSVQAPCVRSSPSLIHEVRDFRTSSNRFYIRCYPSSGFPLSCLRNRKTDMVLIFPNYHPPALNFLRHIFLYCRTPAEPLRTTEIHK